MVVKPCESLQSRLNVAAGLERMKVPLYARRLILTWLRTPVLPREVAERQRTRKDLQIPLTNDQRRAVRLYAAEHDLGTGELLLRVLHTTCPQITEAITASFQETS